MTDATTRGPNPAARVLEDRLSRERLKPYRAAVGGDLDLATVTIAKRRWSTAGSGGGLLQVLQPGRVELLGTDEQPPVLAPRRGEGGV